jgi:hypothetical protein
MATHQFTSDELHQLHDLAKRWAKIVSLRTFGDDGPGLDVDFRTFEQIAHAAAHGLTEGTLQLLLEHRAAKLPPDQPCPHCGRECHTRPSSGTLTARGAEVEQTEPLAHCPAGRRDFFPPPPGPRAG